MSEFPLISCICPTSGKRRRFVEQAVKLFNAQSYPNRELILVDEMDYYGNTCLGTFSPQSNIEYLYIDAMGTVATLTIGAKRNLACSIAKGDIIAHFDDDDLYFPNRLSAQAQPIIDGTADVTALKMSLLLRTRDTTLWWCSDAVHKALFNHDVKCGTLMYRASYWQQGLCYDNGRTGSDVRYLEGLLDRGARLERITGDYHICVRHGDNVTPDIDGMDDKGWQQVEMERYVSREDRAFYEGLREGVRA